MKICVIYDIKGKCPVYCNVTPNENIFIRELKIASSKDDSFVYALYPNDYELKVLSFDLDSKLTVESIPFSSFLNKEVSENE